MTQKILFLRGNTAQSTAYTGLAGEITIDTTANSIRVHDNLTAGGHLLLSQTAVDSQNTNIAVLRGNIVTLTANAGFQFNTLTSLTANAVSQQTAISSLNGTVATHTANIATLTGSTNTLMTNVATLTANAVTQDQTLRTLFANVGYQNDRITALDITVQGISSTQATDHNTLNTLSGTIGGYTANIVSLQNNMQNMIDSASAQATDISALQTAGTAQAANTTSRFTAVNTAIATANTVMTSYVNAVTTAWTANAGAQADAIAGANAAINSASINQLAYTQSYTDAVTAAWTANAGIQANAIVTLFANAGIQANAIASRVRLVAVPTSEMGAPGDIAGDFAKDANFAYVCTTTYDPTTSFVAVADGAGTSGRVFSHLETTLTSLPSFSLIGWTCTTSFGIDTVRAVTFPNANGKVTISVYGIVFQYTGGELYTFIRPSPPAIWKTIPLSTFQSPAYNNVSVESYIGANIGSLWANASSQAGLITTLQSNAGAQADAITAIGGAITAANSAARLYTDREIITVNSTITSVNNRISDANTAVVSYVDSVKANITTPSFVGNIGVSGNINLVGNVYCLDTFAYNVVSRNFVSGPLVVANNVLGNSITSTQSFRFANLTVAQVANVATPLPGTAVYNFEYRKLQVYTGLAWGNVDLSF
jgi:hypothetical protein